MRRELESLWYTVDLFLHRALAAVLLAIALPWAPTAATRDRRDLASFVYPITIHEGPSGKGALHFGGGFFLSAEGDFITVLHLFQNLHSPVSASIRLDEGGSVLECPVESIRAFSRDLDFVIVRVRLAGAKAHVPQLAPSARVGQRVFGFQIHVPGPVGFRAGPLAKAGMQATTAIITDISGPWIHARGLDFLVEGSSGSPIFNQAGGVLGIARSIVKPGAPRSAWTYSSLSITRALAVRKLPAPISLQQFLGQLTPASRP